MGANIGLFTVLLAKRLNSGRRVLAAEPTPGALFRLKINLFRNKVVNCIVFEGVVTNQPGDVELNLVEEAEEYSSIAPLSHPDAPAGGRKKIHVPGKTVDELVEENGLNPGLIKMDVEGAEFLVLQGAQATLKNLKPVVIAEMDDRLLKGTGAKSEEMVALFHHAGYRVVNVGTGLEFPSRWHGNFVGNIIARPV